MPYLEALKAALRSPEPPQNVPEEPPPDSISIDYAIWRFLRAWAQNGELGADEAVLLRQVARWHAGKLFVGILPPKLDRFARLTGVEVTPVGHLSAAPFCPSWLTQNQIDEELGIDSRPCKRRLDESRAAEPYLRFLGYKSWQSQAQKEATWMMLNAPPGSTSLVTLPTGSGKSLCFQAVSRFSTGVTIVIVPTIALAIDQWRSAREVLKNVPGLEPLYFASDDVQMDPNEVAAAIREGRSRLLYTSPEACVSGRLRSLIEELASAGRLSNLVVDEAHIIETWGIYFRVDFQLLSSLLRKWRELSGDTLRTFLLSATFTEKTRGVLQKLFGDKTVWLEFVSQRLRPEIEYFRQLFWNDSDRHSAVLNGVWQLPRPAILYTTEVEAAESLYSELRAIGFSRLGCFTGETPSSERRRLLADWRADKIDLMVATSAFGLGVDKADVRTVIHACLPENMHRYYQEVGRGGRDGNSSLAVLLPTKHDIEVATGMAPKLLSEEVAQQRWEALRQTAIPVSGEDHVYLLNTAARRSGLQLIRTYKENVRWNKRLILQLLRAGKLDILDIETLPILDRPDMNEEWVKVRLSFSPDSPNIARSIDGTRQEEIRVASDGLAQILDYVRGRKPICRLLKKIYGPDVQRVCGGCPECRMDGLPYYHSGHLEFVIPESRESQHTIIADFPDLLDSRNANAVKNLVRKLVQDIRLRRFATSEEFFGVLMAVLEGSFDRTDFELYRVDLLDNLCPTIFVGEPLGIFHIRSFDHRTRRLRTGSDVLDFVCHGVRISDATGRFVGEADGWHLHHGLESWIEQKGAYVY